MKNKLLELQKLMVGRGLTEVADQIEETLRIHSAMAQGMNCNQNSTSDRRKSIQKTNPADGNPLNSVSEETIYKTAVSKCSSSSSEEGEMNTSDETINTINNACDHLMITTISEPNRQGGS